MNLGAIGLTLRMHRFEVLFVLVLFALTAVSAAVAASSAEAALPSASCQQEWYETAGGVDIVSGACGAELRAFAQAADATSLIWGPIAVVVPWLAGIVVGVPLVGRELDAGSASLAWSLTGRRARWLLGRLLPMLLLIVIGSAVVGLLLGRMADAAQPFNHQLGPGRLPVLEHIGREGLAFATRSAAAFGIGLLSGAVVGRVTTAAVVAAVASLVLFLALSVGLPAIVAEQVATWGPGQDEEHGYNLRLLGRGYRAGDGSILSEAEVDREWVGSEFEDVFRTVPTEAFADFVRADQAVSLAVAAGTLFLAFPVVSRRRPR